jgi:hypothetical protein
VQPPDPSASGRDSGRGRSLAPAGSAVANANICNIVPSSELDARQATCHVGDRTIAAIRNNTALTTPIPA